MKKRKVLRRYGEVEIEIVKITDTYINLQRSSKLITLARNIHEKFIARDVYENRYGVVQKSCHIFKRYINKLMADSKD